MSLPTCVNSIGLVADIAGALLIWRFGLLEPLSRTGAKYLVTGLLDEKEKAKAARFHVLSTVGVVLIIIGFALPLASNFLR